MGSTTCLLLWTLPVSSFSPRPGHPWSGLGKVERLMFSRCPFPSMLLHQVRATSCDSRFLAAEDQERPALLFSMVCTHFWWSQRLKVWTAFGGVQACKASCNTEEDQNYKQQASSAPPPGASWASRTLSRCSVPPRGGRGSRARGGASGRRGQGPQVRVHFSHRGRGRWVETRTLH